MRKILFILIVSFVFVPRTYSQDVQDKTFRFAKEHLENKKWGDAHQLLSYLIKKDKDNYEYYYYRGKARVKMFHQNMAVNDFKKGISILEKKMLNEPNDSKHFKYLGLSQFQLGQYTKSIESYNKCLKLIEIDSVKSRIYCLLGSSYFVKKEYRKSIECLDQAIYFDKNNETAFIDRAMAKVNFNDNYCGCNDWLVYKTMINDTNYSNYSGGKGMSGVCSEYIVSKKLYWNDIIARVKNITPEQSILRMDSIEVTRKFYKDNSENILEMADTVSTVPINLCLNDLYSFKLNVNKEGVLTLISIVKGSPNPALNNLIFAKLNSTKLIWKPRIVNGEATDFTWIFKHEFINDNKNIKIKYHTDNTSYSSTSNRRDYNTLQIGADDDPNIKRCEENERYYRLGVSFFLKKKYELAKHNFEKALAYNPYDLDSHYNLGMVYLKLENVKDACGCFELGMKIGDRPSYDQFKKNCSN